MQKHILWLHGTKCVIQIFYVVFSETYADYHILESELKRFGYSELFRGKHWSCKKLKRTLQDDLNINDTINEKKKQ